MFLFFRYLTVVLYPASLCHSLVLFQHCSSGLILLLLPQKGRSGALYLIQTFNLPHLPLFFNQQSYNHPNFFSKHFNILSACLSSPFLGEEGCYSVLKLFTGLETAAFIACKLTVTNATRAARIPAIINTHQ